MHRKIFKQSNSLPFPAVNTLLEGIGVKVNSNKQTKMNWKNDDTALFFILLWYLCQPKKTTKVDKNKDKVK